MYWTGNKIIYTNFLIFSRRAFPDNYIRGESHLRVLPEDRFALQIQEVQALLQLLVRQKVFALPSPTVNILNFTTTLQS